ncbi:MAG: MFS transporter [Desulfobacterales bacterium]|nr:MFS transporter [Desulfobacterales bacterium]
MTNKSMAKLLRYRWLIFTILSSGYILVYFHRIAPAVVAEDMMRDLNAGGTLTGFLSSAYFYSYAVMQLPAGLLSDSWGPRNTITIFLAISFAGSLIFGFSTSPFWAILGRALVGGGVSMLFIPTLKILTEWFQKKEFAFMTGLLMAMGGIGSLSAAAPLVMLNNLIGWRFSFVLVGLLTFILAIIVWFFVRDSPKDMGLPSITSDGQTKSSSTGLLQGLYFVISSISFWPVALWFFFNFAISFSFIGLWGGPYLTQVYGLSKSQSGQILSMFSLAMIVGSPMQSFILDKILKGRKPAIIFSSIITLLITSALAFYTGKIPVWGLYLLCLGFGIFTSSIVVVAFTIVKELFPIQIAGTATGIVNIFPFAGGAIFQPILGYILEKGGVINNKFTLPAYQQAFFVLFICAALALFFSLLFKEPIDKSSI